MLDGNRPEDRTIVRRVFGSVDFISVYRQSGFANQLFAASDVAKAEQSSSRLAVHAEFLEVTQGCIKPTER